MKLSEVKAVAQRVDGPLAQRHDLEHAHHVGRGLAGPGDVPADLELHKAGILARILDHKVVGLVKGPTLSM